MTYRFHVSLRSDGIVDFSNGVLYSPDPENYSINNSGASVVFFEYSNVTSCYRSIYRCNLDL